MILSRLNTLSNTVNQLLSVRRTREHIHHEEILRKASQMGVAMAAHNINNRLAAVEPLLWLYRRFEKNQPLLKPVNDDLERLSHACLSMVSRIKEFFGPIILRPVKRHLRGAIIMALRRSSVRGTVEVPEELEVSWDITLIEDALRQMFDNTRQMQPGMDEPAIEITGTALEQEQSEWVRLIVRDFGPGIKPEHHRLIFEPFWTRRPGAGNKHGTGLGLYWVRRVVAAHNGSIEVRSEPGEGASFILTLPTDLQRPHFANLIYVSFPYC